MTWNVLKAMLNLIEEKKLLVKVHCKCFFIDMYVTEKIVFIKEK